MVLCQRFVAAVLLFGLIAISAFAADTVEPLETDPLYQLSNLRRGENNSLLFNFKRTKKATGFTTVFIKGNSKGQLVSITATINPYVEEDIVTLTSLLPSNSTSPIDLELYLVTLHTVGEEKYLYSLVSNPVQIGDPGEPTIARAWTTEETQGYSEHLKKKPTTIKRYEVSIDIPVTSVKVPLTAELKNGTKLHACYASKWSPITTLSENPDGSVFVRWDEWGETYDCNKLREELIITKSVLARLSKHPEGKFPKVHPSLLAPGGGTASAKTADEKPLKKYPVSIDVPADSQFVPDDAILKEATKLQACYAQKWNPITFLSHHPDGTLTVRWDDYGAAFDCRMHRNELIIKKTLLQTTSSDDPKDSLSRVWTDSTGKFKVTAKLISQSNSTVTLLTDTGKTLELALSRLSQDDQDFLKKQDEESDNPFE
jgi:SLA1 homology domain 1, SHD1